MAGSQEIRGTWKQRMIGKLAGWLIRIMGWTLRYEIKGLKQLTEKWEGKPVIYALWHNRIFAMPDTRPKLSKGREIVVLTSASKDGAILENAVRVFKIGSVRGSSSRRGAAALVALRKKLAAGSNICITPDGPRGPLYHLSPGVIKLAQAGGAPIIPLRVEFSRCWRLKSWDRFCIPKPFSKVTVTLEEGIEISKELDEDTFEQERVSLENLMKEGMD